MVLCLVLFLIGENFWIFHQPPQVTELAKGYIRILTVSTIPLMLFLAIKQFSDGLSVTVPAMVITFGGVLVNIFFNWVFIYGNLTFPAMGVNGSAIATLLARSAMALLLIIYVFRSKMLKEYLPPLISTFNTWPVLLKIVRVGFPSGLQLFFEVGAYTGAGLFVGWLGTNELAANQIVLCLAAITYMAASGLSVAGSIRVGNAFGGGDKEGVLRAGTVSLILTAIFMMASCFSFIFLNRELVYAFSQDENVISIAATILVVAGFFQLSDGLQAVGLGILRGVEDVNVPTIITLVAYWGIALPVGYVLGFVFDFGIQGVWMGLLVGLTISALWLNGRFFRLVITGKTKEYVATRLEKAD
jgi:MATE family multidrug resistance protein